MFVMVSILFKDKVKVSKTSQERVNHKANETRSRRLNKAFKVFLVKPMRFSEK